MLKERVAKARDYALGAAHPETPAYCPPVDPTAFSPQARLVASAMKSTKLNEGAFNCVGVTWADISISPYLKERALLLVERFAHELVVLGAIFENARPSCPPLRRGARCEAGSKRNCFTFRGQRFFLRTQERITQELVPPPPPKPLRAGARQPAWEYRPPEYRYIPTGKVYASIVDALNYYESYRVENTVRRTIEVKVQKAVRWVAYAAIRRNVENEVRAERELAPVRKRRSGALPKRTRTHCWAADGV